MSPPAQRITALAMQGPVQRADLPDLCHRLIVLLEEQRSEVVLCDVRGLPADAVSVDALARLNVAARRHSCRLKLNHCSSELRELLAFMGLSDVLSG